MHILFRWIKEPKFNYLDLNGQHVEVLPVNGNCNDCKGRHICRHTGKCLHKPANKLIIDLSLLERAFILKYLSISALKIDCCANVLIFQSTIQLFFKEDICKTVSVCCQFYT